MIYKPLGYIKHWKQRTLGISAPVNIRLSIYRTIGNIGPSGYRSQGSSVTQTKKKKSPGNCPGFFAWQLKIPTRYRTRCTKQLCSYKVQWSCNYFGSTLENLYECRVLLYSLVSWLYKLLILWYLFVLPSIWPPSLDPISGAAALKWKCLESS